MSVMLLEYKEIANMSENIIKDLSENPELVKELEETKFFTERNKGFSKTSIDEFIGRAIWYGFIANKTAYELQYQENTNIDFKEPLPKFINYNNEDINNSLGSLLYNIYTNDGNCFIQDDWLNIIVIIRDYYKDLCILIN
tara:strand:+ start:507 stop:926 length:420 start_codon:yes stop_codon:yes gene_type:complete